MILVGFINYINFICINLTRNCAKILLAAWLRQNCAKILLAAWLRQDPVWEDVALTKTTSWMFKDTDRERRERRRIKSVP